MTDCTSRMFDGLWIGDSFVGHVYIETRQFRFPRSKRRRIRRKWEQLECNFKLMLVVRE